jgi:hypothetical protein
MLDGKPPIRLARDTIQLLAKNVGRTLLNGEFLVLGDLRL